MEKPIVLKQRFRLSWGWAVLLALQLALIIWVFWAKSDRIKPDGIWFWLPYIVVINASVFFERIKLERDQIIVGSSLIGTRKYRFVRILCYSVKPQDDKLGVELTVEQMWPQKSELFGVEFSSKGGKPASIRERQISFSIELDQAEILMNYLHAQGAVEDVFAEVEWRKLQILLEFERELCRWEEEQGELSNEDKWRFLAEMEEKLSQVEEKL